jgi:hypothetical protein
MLRNPHFRGPPEEKKPPSLMSLPVENVQIPKKDPFTPQSSDGQPFRTSESFQPQSSPNPFGGFQNQRNDAPRSSLNDSARNSERLVERIPRDKDVSDICSLSVCEMICEKYLDDRIVQFKYVFSYYQFRLISETIVAN